jgi:hypothetical protein
MINFLYNPNIIWNSSVYEVICAEQEGHSSVLGRFLSCLKVDALSDSRNVNRTHSP